MSMISRTIALLLLGITSACVGSTGGDIVTFGVTISGRRNVDPSASYEFDSGRGFHVKLTSATLHVGALYLNRSVPIAGAQATSCILPGLYVAQAVPPRDVHGLDVDVLSPTPQIFPALGSGTADPARSGEVWLTGGDVDAIDDPTPIVDIVGEAEKDGLEYPFEAHLTIGRNRATVPTNPALPGSAPICKQRIVSPIPVPAIVPKAGARLNLEVDPRAWFGNVDFTTLTASSTSPLLYRFADDDSDAASKNLYQGVRASIGAYSFSFEP